MQEPGQRTYPKLEVLCWVPLWKPPVLWIFFKIQNQSRFCDSEFFWKIAIQGSLIAKILKDWNRRSLTKSKNCTAFVSTLTTHQQKTATPNHISKTLNPNITACEGIRDTHHLFPERVHSCSELQQCASQIKENLPDFITHIYKTLVDK